MAPGNRCHGRSFSDTAVRGYRSGFRPPRQGGGGQYVAGGGQARCARAIRSSSARAKACALSFGGCHAAPVL